jgi:membrane protease YdiL (CAAX protease family)
VGCLSPLVVAGLGALLAYFTSGQWPDLASVGTVEYLGDIGMLPALLVWILTFGFAEEIGWSGFLGLSMSLLMGSVLLGWLYNRTAGSIFVVAIWHAAFDLFTGAKSSQGAVAATMSTLVIVWVVCLLAAELWRRRSRGSAGSGLLRTPQVS